MVICGYRLLSIVILGYPWPVVLSYCWLPWLSLVVYSLWLSMVFLGYRLLSLVISVVILGNCLQVNTQDLFN